MKDYFINNWLNCVEKWTKFSRVDLQNYNVNTNNTVETINKQIKAFSKRNVPMHTCLKNLLRYILYTKQNTTFISTTRK